MTFLKEYNYIPQAKFQSNLIKTFQSENKYFSKIY